MNKVWLVTVCALIIFTPVAKFYLQSSLLLLAYPISLGLCASLLFVKIVHEIIECRRRRERVRRLQGVERKVKEKEEAQVARKVRENLSLMPLDLIKIIYIFAGPAAHRLISDADWEGMDPEDPCRKINLIWKINLITQKILIQKIQCVEFSENEECDFDSGSEARDIKDRFHLERTKILFTNLCIIAVKVDAQINIEYSLADTAFKNAQDAFKNAQDAFKNARSAFLVISRENLLFKYDAENFVHAPIYHPKKTPRDHRWESWPILDDAWESWTKSVEEMSMKEYEDIVKEMGFSLDDGTNQENWLLGGNPT